MNAHAAVNETVSVIVTSSLSTEKRVGVQRFLRKLDARHMYEELIGPLLDGGRLQLALATTDRPWPPKGVGSLTVHALSIAMRAAGDRALLTPVITSLEHTTNVGLVGALTRVLLDELIASETAEVSYLVRVEELALERTLAKAGFRRSELQAATEWADYTEYVASPSEMRDRLGLAAARQGDILRLVLDSGEFDALSQYHFALSSAARAFLADSIEHAALLPGLLDIVATLPPGGVPPGTPGPKKVIVIEPGER
jgi:hypothetical protein